MVFLILEILHKSESIYTYLFNMCIKEQILVKNDFKIPTYTGIVHQHDWHAG